MSGRWGSLLVEVLTQRASVGDGIRTGDLALPESLPTPFLEIARQCLRLDPQRRWTVPDIAARLLPLPTPPKARPVGRYGLALAAVGVAVVAIFAASKYSSHSPQTGSNDLQTVERPAVPSSPDSRSADSSATTPKDSNSTKESDKREGTPAPPPHSPAKASAETTRGAVLEQVLPPISRRSRDTITGKVRVGVKVAVDSSGKVTRASLVSPGPSQYFAKAALDSSRHWKFAAPQVDGQAVASEWILRFEFGRQSTEVHPQQANP